MVVDEITAVVAVGGGGIDGISRSSLSFPTQSSNSFEPPPSSDPLSLLVLVPVALLTPGTVPVLITASVCGGGLLRGGGGGA